MTRTSSLLFKRFASKPLPGFLLGALAFLYLNLFVPPLIPIWRGEDEGIFLHDAMRMLEGQVIYRDFFQFTLPGTQLVYLALFKAFGLRAWIPNTLLIILGLSLTWLSIGISKTVMHGWVAFLPGLLFLTFAFRRAFAVSHHWWSELAIMAAMAVVIEKRSPARLALAAALCGLAACFTQTHGLLAVLGLAAFLFWERHQKRQPWRTLLKREVGLCAIFLATVVALNVYWVWKAGLNRFFNCTVTFVWKYYPAEPWNTLRVYVTGVPSFASWYKLPALGTFLFMHAVLPIVYLRFFIRYRREAHTRPLEPWDRLMLLNIMGLFLLLGIAPAPSWFRLCAVSLPALILLAWLVSLPGKFRQALARSLWVAALMLTIAEPWRSQHHWRAYLDLPTGRTAFLNPLLHDSYKWVSDHTRPSEFFFEGVWADFYFALDLRNPAEVPSVRANDFTRPEQVQNLVQALEKYRVRFVLWSLGLDTVGKHYYPPGDHLGPLRAYLRDRYRVVKTFPNAEQVWERKVGAR